MFPRMPRPSSDETRRQFGLRLDEELMTALKHLAVDERTSMNQLVEEAIRDLLRKKGRRIPRARLLE